MTKEFTYDSLDYFKVLGITPSSSDDELRTKYRELVKTWHPDHNTSPDAVEMFQKISAAYDVLKDSKNRLKYILWENIFYYFQFWYVGIR